MTALFRDLDPQKDFLPLARLFTEEMNDPCTIEGLRDDYERHKERILRLRIASSEQDEVLGFNWITRERNEGERAYFYIVVSCEHRHKGIGSRLYQDIEAVAGNSGILELRATFPDTLPEARLFAEKRGFNLISHSIGMQLELDTLNLQPYHELMEDLERQGFEFTSMEALGNTEEAQ